MPQPDINPVTFRQIKPLLSEADLSETESALAPLATAAGDLRRRTITGAVTLSTTAVIAVIAGVVTGPNLVGNMIGTLLGVGAIVILARFRAIWKGKVKPATLYVPVTTLPDAAQTLLDGIRHGAVRVRFATDARPPTEYLVLPKAEVLGPFAPLLLSPDPEVSRLALWSLFVGDKLTLLFEVVDQNAFAPETVAAAIQQGSAPRPFNRFILLPADDLDAILELAFPLDVRNSDEKRYNKLVCCAFRIARELLHSRNYKSLKPLIN